jgi:hypothetical protein
VRAAALAAVLLLSGCLSAPYPNLFERLDVANQVSGDTWVSYADTPDGEEIRLLVVGAPTSESPVPRFSFTAVRPRSVRKLQGTWATSATQPSFVLSVEFVFEMPDESQRPVTQRVGATRRQVSYDEVLDVSMVGPNLVVSGGSGELDGTYTLFPQALAALGGPVGVTPACAFRVFNLTILSSQVRIPGFNGTSILQYTTPATFVGEVTGTVRIGVSNVLSPLTEITYTAYADFTGAGVEGTQSTRVNTAGTGSMFGTLPFVLQPLEPLPPIEGTVGYGVSGGGGDSIQLTGGNVTGGSYAVDVSGGASGLVDAVNVPGPTTAACLGLRP